MGLIGHLTGAAETGISFQAGAPAIELAARAALAAVRDAGLELADIDGIAVVKGSDLAPSDRPSMELADYLGLSLRYVDNTLVGGVSPVIQIGHATDAIAAGRCSRVLVVYASTQASDRGRRLGGPARPADHAVTNAERAAGLPFPIGSNALAAARHAWQYGTTPEQLASVAIAQRSWAQLNPAALRRTPLSMEEALASPVIASPLRKIDCCLISDGAAAVVVEGADRAGGRAVEIRGFSEYHRQYTVLGVHDLLTTGATRTGPAALEQAGGVLADIGLVQLYDAFSILPLVLLENLGLAEPGKAGQLVLEGGTMPGGRLPMNTQGGGLAHCHPGIYGLFLVVEAVCQLRGEAGDRQVPDPRLGLVQGSGGGAFGGSQATLVLAGS